MKNGIRLFRERKGLSQSELARRIDTSRQHVSRMERGTRQLTREWAKKMAAVLGCTPQELLYPESARIDADRFRNVFDIATGDGPETPEPGLAIQLDLLMRLIPNVRDHRLRMTVVDSNDLPSKISRGDIAVIDLDDNRPTRPGVYAIEIGGVMQWRILAPTTDGRVTVRGDGGDIPDENVTPDKLTILGRAKLKISTI